MTATTQDDEEEDTEWARWLRESASDVDDAVTHRWRALRRRLGVKQHLNIQPYLGYANDESAWVSGRVLANKPVGDPMDDDSWWDNLVNTYKRWNSDEVPGAVIEATLDGITQRVMTDEEGYYNLSFELDKPMDPRQLWHRVELRLVDAPDMKHDADAPSIVAESAVLAPPRRATFGVISDMDDTVIHTGATHITTAARLTFFNNAKTRKPLDGVAAFYQALRRGPVAADQTAQDNPIFYVSSSAWNLYDLLTAFLELNDVPQGPMFLQDLGFDDDKFLTGGHTHKLDRALTIMEAYPDLPFVLIGDSGQEDATLYLKAARRHGNRIKAIFIRDVDPEEASERDEAVSNAIIEAEMLGVPMFLIDNSRQAIEQAVALELIDPSMRDEIESETRADEKRD